MAMRSSLVNEGDSLERQAFNLSKPVVDSDLQVLIEELKLIRDNVCGGLKQNSNINLTHSEVISFARAFVKAVEAEMITPFYGWDNQAQDRVIFYLNLIRTHGIPHCDRSRAAQKCLNFIEEQKKKLDTQNLDTQNDNDWDKIPF